MEKNISSQAHHPTPQVSQPAAQSPPPFLSSMRARDASCGPRAWIVISRHLSLRLGHPKNDTPTESSATPSRFPSPGRKKTSMFQSSGPLRTTRYERSDRTLRIRGAPGIATITRSKDATRGAPGLTAGNMKLLGALLALLLGT